MLCVWSSTWTITLSKGIYSLPWDLYCRRKFCIEILLLNSALYKKFLRKLRRSRTHLDRTSNLDYYMTMPPLFLVHINPHPKHQNWCPVNSKGQLDQYKDPWNQCLNFKWLWEQVAITHIYHIYQWLLVMIHLWKKVNSDVIMWTKRPHYASMPQTEKQAENC